MPKSGYNYCADLVKKNDHNRYLSALFAPHDKRPSLFALYAFAFEIAVTRERVKEPMLGEIRLQWWREAIDGLYAGAPRKHEVIDALGHVLEQVALPQVLFNSFIDAHGLDLADRPIATTEELLAYSDATSSNVILLGAQILTGGELSEDLRKAARSAGRAWALTRLMRSRPLGGIRIRDIFPEEILSRHEIPNEEDYDGVGNMRHKEAFREMLDLAQAWLDVARLDLRQVSDEALPAFLPVSLCGSYLRVMARPDFDPSRQSAELSLLGRQFRMIKAMLIRRL